MSKIKVHILNFWSLPNSHIEIALEAKTDKGNLYYCINPWEEPKNKAEINDADCLNSIRMASESQVIEIDDDLDDIIQEWKNKCQNADFGCCINNCADVTDWFLKEYAGIPNPGSCGSPITCNYLCCGLFAPSFVQCCTLPGRVFDYAKNAITQAEPANETSPLLKNSSVIN